MEERRGGILFSRSLYDFWVCASITFQKYSISRRLRVTRLFPQVLTHCFTNSTPTQQLHMERQLYCTYCKLWHSWVVSQDMFEYQAWHCIGVRLHLSLYHICTEMLWTQRTASIGKLQCNMRRLGYYYFHALATITNILVPSLTSKSKLLRHSSHFTTFVDTWWKLQREDLHHALATITHTHTLVPPLSPRSCWHTERPGSH